MHVRVFIDEPTAHLKTSESKFNIKGALNVNSMKNSNASELSTIG